ncbi:helix-turn-helix domain-containing protein [Paenibacillus sp. 481]|uniref:helix-turn-helix domain-containing protein n=1 Tax=Paenibacillus sp. 481 TaxID=2835869 RepID=UPI001E294A1A|nr:helix-turn-helix transcriptional regulator [Paenibacillus sp. 481]UHA75094.1 helix-turn-helix transcriptional regulator [Paenibacillus sp. 481]
MPKTSSQYMTIGDLIKKYRCDSHLTQVQVQSMSGVTTASISRIESGETRHSDFKTIKAIANGLNIPFDLYIPLYIENENRPDSLLAILQEAIQVSAPIAITTHIATKFLESPLDDSIDLTEKLYKTTATMTDPSIQLMLYNTIIHHSREHGIMTYMAKGMYQQYMIERNDFSKLLLTYQSGRNILHYVNFLSDDESIVFHYSLGVHALSLMLYEESIELSAFAERNDAGRNKWNATKNLFLCTYHLQRFDESKHYLEKYKKLKDTQIDNDAIMFEAMLSKYTESTAAALEKLNSYLERSSQYNLVYVVSELVDIYLQIDDLSAAVELLKYEEDMVESLKDKRATPDKRARLAYFYRIVGKAFLHQNTERAFDYYLKSAAAYMQIGLHEKALESVSYIHDAIIEDSSRFSTDILVKINALYAKAMNKAY